MTTIRFEEVKHRAEKRTKCSVCGKPLSRVTTIIRTVNPFNKNEQGVPKTRDEVRADCAKEALKWQQKPEKCKGCAK